VQVWILHHIQLEPGRSLLDHAALLLDLEAALGCKVDIVGEAARKVSDALQRQHPEVPWPQIVAMRNILVHDYFGVDVEEVWAAVERDIPDLKCKVAAILKGL
jgi:uncharacterized protein with HEPN domain